MPADDRSILGPLAERLLAGHLVPEDLREDDSLPDRVGRYEVLRSIGRGAFGRVFLARDPELGRTVAVKLLARTSAKDGERFRREMHLLARLEVPGIVRIYDAGLSEDGPFFVMEFVDEPPLSEVSLPLEDAVRVLEHVARACHAAHERGIVHRDLKPSNVLVGARPVVLDFGVATLLHELDDAAERGARIGTPEYMAPEQAAGRVVGPWTDVHALGAMLYEQLTGRTPFAGALPDEPTDAILARVATAVPPRPRSLVPTVPAALERTALRALAKRPEERHGSALDLAEELRRWREGAPTPGRRLALVAIGMGAVSLATLLLAPRLLGPPRRPPPPPEERSPASAPPGAPAATPREADLPREADPPPPHDRPPPPRRGDRPPPRPGDRPPPPRDRPPPPDDDRPPPPEDEDGPPPRRPPPPRHPGWRPEDGPPPPGGEPR